MRKNWHQRGHDDYLSGRGGRPQSGRTKSRTTLTALGPIDSMNIFAIVSNDVATLAFTYNGHTFIVRGPITTVVDRITFRCHVIRKTQGLCEQCRHAIHFAADQLIHGITL